MTVFWTGDEIMYKHSARQSAFEADEETAKKKLALSVEELKLTAEYDRSIQTKQEDAVIPQDIGTI